MRPVGRHATAVTFLQESITLSCFFASSFLEGNLAEAFFPGMQVHAFHPWYLESAKDSEGINQNRSWVSY